MGTVSQANDPLGTKPLNNHWVVKGWSKCSKECGTGKQHLILRCQDTLSGKIIGKSHCNGEQPPLVTKTRTCNSFPYHYKWFVGRWEYCTKSCGTEGRQFRQTFCIPAGQTALAGVNNGSSQVWQHMVDPRKCRGEEKPKTVQGCNREPCPEPAWSPCSISCGIPGQGLQTRLTECPSGHNTTCNRASRPCHDLRPCPDSSSSNPASPDCPSGDASLVCGDDVMMRYCVVPSYFKLCCKSCAHMKSALIYV